MLWSKYALCVRCVCCVSGVIGVCRVSRYAILSGGAGEHGSGGARERRKLFWFEPSGETEEDPSVLAAEVNEFFS